MIPEVRFGKKLACGLAGLFCLALFAQTTLYAADKIVLPKYPRLMIGFTTSNFSKVYPTNVANIKKLLDFASEQGFAFIEIRDSEATLTLADCKELAAYAKQKGVEVIYAMNTGLLDSNYWEVFSRGVVNAAVFDGPKVVRTGANGAEMLADAKKTHWTAAEFAKLVENGNKAGKTAKEHKLKFLVENAREALKGDGVTSFGTMELFGPKGVSRDVGLQLDVANFFCTSRVPSTPDAANAFVESQAGRIGYTHLKTSKNHKPQPVLNGNELSFETYFKLLQKHRKNFVAIELDPAGTADEAYANHLKSLAYLKKNF
ncbi:MAG: sugar phosphate isomerase/epimerase [Candidatus Korobacteraceae bacterium]|jgi:sugar phosphate isomerase/epimerase